MQRLSFFPNEAAINHEIIKERHQGVKKIESQMVELNEMFESLAVLLDDQAEDVDMLAVQTERALSHTDKGVKEVKEAEVTQREARCFIL